MRKPRDFDAELKALDSRAQQLKARKLVQLGELVTATSADALTIEELAGALLAIAITTETQRREAWRRRGAAFFSGQRKAGKAGDATGQQQSGAPADDGREQPPRADPGAA